MDQFLVVLNQIGIFLILICLGILIVKIKILDKHSLFGISQLVMKVALPSYIFVNAISSATFNSLIESLVIIPIGIIIYIFLIVLSLIIEKIFGLKGNRKKVYRASLVFGNIGFMGIPLVSAIYPGSAVLYVSIFTIVDQLIFWTYGLNLTFPVSDKKEKIAPKSLMNLFSPPLIAIILAIIFIICGAHLPAVLTLTLTYVGNTSMPLALIYIGGILCSANIRPVLKCGEIYSGIVLKMVLIPVIFYIVMLKIGFTDDLSGTLAYIIALPGIEMVPMLAESNGSDGNYAVCAIMMTTIACLITIPIVSLGISF